MDNDVCNAYPLCKLNPEIVPMHAYQACGYVGFATGQSFGGYFCPVNWDPVAQARIQMARYQWHREPANTLHASSSYVDAPMQLSPEIPPYDYYTGAVQAHLKNLCREDKQ
eukprot:jgi/Psemu1/28314/gm1.28314_g